MKNKKWLGIIIPIFLVISIIIIGMITINYVFFSKLSGKSENEIINLYEKNQTLFKNSIEELLKEENDMIFEIINNELSIKKLIDDFSTHSVSVIELEEKEFNKYANTIMLIDKLDIKCVNVDALYKNVDFLIDSTGIAESIAYISDEERYKWGGYEGTLNLIEDKWFYVKEE